MIGYYAHSHGSGHCNFARSFYREFGRNLTIFTDREDAINSDMPVVQLPNDYADGTEFQGSGFKPPKALHYAPVNLRKIARRNEIILKTILEKGIRLLIVDVSVEVAMLARVSSIPYIYRRQPGNRNDFPHLNAYEGAAFLIAYFPPDLESEATPDWVIEKTVYLGFISKHLVQEDIERIEVECEQRAGDSEIKKNGEERKRAYDGAYRNKETKKSVSFPKSHKRNLVHILGFGGSGQIDFKDLRDEFNIYGVGPRGEADLGQYDKHFGVVPSTRPYIASADVIFAASGANATSEILSMGKRFVAIPETRPFEEQLHTAKAIQREGWGIDYSQYGSATEAVTAFEKLGSAPLPVCDVDRFKAFCTQLKSYEFRLDVFCDRSSFLHNNHPSEI